MAEKIHLALVSLFLAVLLETCIDNTANSATPATKSIIITGTIVAPIELKLEQLGDVVVVTAPSYGIAVATGNNITVRASEDELTLAGGEWLSAGERLVTK